MATYKRDDFRYQTLKESELQFDNHQRIHDYINEHVEGVEIRFGTLSDYFKAVLGAFAVPILKGSFFTYADRNEDYWSGYFTSRIFDKALDRQLERVLYAATTMGGTKLELRDSRRALSLFQHHDGVTGTAKSNVVLDYANRIHKAIQYCQSWMIKKLSEQYPGGIKPCWKSDAPRGLSQNFCTGEIIVYNPLGTEQSCGNVVIPGWSHKAASLPCEVPGAMRHSNIQFDDRTGLMIHPVKEEWMVWKVKEGGAYLFFPGVLKPHPELELKIDQGGYVVKTKDWKRTIVEKSYPTEFGTIATVIDFIYETNLQNGNEEWITRISADILSNGVFHTDLNGYNFDTHHFRKDMPIQSQVFPMPTMSSVEDSKQRLTVLSEHAQGTASLGEGSIDVWLDRRLLKDDNRGLGQGVMDNVPTRTRLRVILEQEGFDSQSAEFGITPLASLMWKELNHPLEMFGRYSSGGQVDRSHQVIAEKHFMLSTDDQKYKIPAVYMVYNRVQYLRQAIDSLRQSDFPRDRVPIIISHDGYVEEVIHYVNSIKSEFQVIQVFHPFACAEHKDTFPGDDPKLNLNYSGDAYGNKREGKVTCCKHHFTWLINHVFRMNEMKDADGFMFLEEDYIVAETIYETIQTGLTHIDGKEDTYFGLTFDITEGYTYSSNGHQDEWFEKRFITGPMAIRRSMFQKIKQNAKEYCTFDDYNW